MQTGTPIPDCHARLLHVVETDLVLLILLALRLHFFQALLPGLVLRRLRDVTSTWVRLVRATLPFVHGKLVVLGELVCQNIDLLGLFSFTLNGFLELLGRPLLVGLDLSKHGGHVVLHVSMTGDRTEKYFFGDMAEAQ